MKRLDVGAAVIALAAALLTGCGSSGSTDHGSANVSPSAGTNTSSSSAKPTSTSGPTAGKTLRSGSGGHINKNDLDLQIEKALTPKSGAYVPMAQCEHGLTGPVGSTVRCRITVPGGQLWAKATVTKVMRNGIAYKLGHATAPAGH